MKRNETYYEFESGFEGVEDYAHFLEHLLSYGYGLRIVYDNYLVEFVPERLDINRFINEYFSSHHHSLTIQDSSGKKVAECDSLSEFKLLNVGGGLEKLIEDYISRK